VRNEFSKLAPPSKCKLEKIDQLTKEVFRFKFGFKNPDSISSYVPGMHILFRLMDKEGKYLTRPFTPVNKIGEKGYFDILVKFRSQGLVSEYLKKMEIG
jgi:NAD(P)H-flavin reductase